MRKTEDDFKLVACFDEHSEPCVISPVCGLKHALHRALAAYFAVLDEYTIADLSQIRFIIVSCLALKNKLIPFSVGKRLSC